MAGWALTSSYDEHCKHFFLYLLPRAGGKGYNLDASVNAAKMCPRNDDDRMKERFSTRTRYCAGLYWLVF